MDIGEIINNRHNSTKHCPVLEANDWNELLKLAPLDLIDKIKQTKPELQKDPYMLLSPPATLARMIALFTPQLLLKPEIKVLCVGAEKVDIVDGGAWITALCPHFLGIETRISLTAVGIQADPPVTGLQTFLDKSKHAEIYRLTLKKFLKKHNPSKFDVAVFFSPGFEAHMQWLDDNSFRKLIASGLPTLATSLSEDDFGADKVILQAYGYSVKARGKNPFVFADTGPMARFSVWSSVIWQVGSDVPEINRRPDHAKINALKAAENYSISQGQLEITGLGEKVSSLTPSGTPVWCRTLLADTFLTEENELAVYSDGAITATGIYIRPDCLPSPPPDDATPIEKAVWAAEVIAIAAEPGNVRMKDGAVPDILPNDKIPDLDETIDDSTITVQELHPPNSPPDMRLCLYSIRTEKYMTLNNCRRLLKRLKSDGAAPDTVLNMQGPKGIEPIIRLAKSPEHSPVLVHAQPDTCNTLEHEGLPVYNMTLGELTEFADEMSRTSQMPCMPMFHVQITGNIKQDAEGPSVGTGEPKGIYAAVGLIKDKTSVLTIWFEPLEE